MTFAWNETQLDCSSFIILMSETLLQTLDFATCFITFSTANLIFSLQLQIYRSVFAFWSLKNLAVNSAKAHRTLFKFTCAGRGGLMDHRGLWWSTVTHPVIYFKQNGLMWRGPGKKLAFKSGHTNGPFFFFFLWIWSVSSFCEWHGGVPSLSDPLSSLFFVICRVSPSERMRKVAVAGMYY